MRFYVTIYRSYIVIIMALLQVLLINYTVAQVLLINLSLVAWSGIIDKLQLVFLATKKNHCPCVPAAP